MLVFGEVFGVSTWMSRTGSDRNNGERIIFSPLTFWASFAPETHDESILDQIAIGKILPNTTWMSQEVSKWLVNGVQPSYKWGILGL